MKWEKMIQYMDLLDDKFIVEADPANAVNIVKREAKVSILLRFGAVAALFVFVIGILIAMPYLQQDDPVFSDETVNTHESSGPIEDTSNHGGEENFPADITPIQPTTAMWNVFEVSGKPTQYLLLTDEQAEKVPYASNPLLYYQNDEGIWMFWTVLNNAWTMEGILELYNITSEDSILQIDTTEKNTKAKEKVQLMESDHISEFYRIFKTAEVMHMIPWGETHSLQGKNEYDIDTVLFVDILTEYGDVFSLQLYQHADCLVQNGETFYQLKDGEGKKMFEILKGITVDEYVLELKEGEVHSEDNSTSIHQLFVMNEITEIISSAPKYRDPELHYSETWDIDTMAEYLNTDLKEILEDFCQVYRMEYCSNEEFSVMFENSGQLVEDISSYSAKDDNGTEVVILASKLRPPYDCIYQTDTEIMTAVPIADSGETLEMLICEYRNKNSFDMPMYVADFMFGGIYYRITTENISDKQLAELIYKIINS